MKDVDKYIVSMTASIKEAVRQMDKGGIGFCVCVDEKERVVGVVSDGDFRRAVLNGQSLDDSVDRILNEDFTYVSSDYKRQDLESIFFSSKIQQVPILEDGCLVDIITAETFIGVERKAQLKTLDNTVVIMAGGQGKRLDPFTRILPKPLIPLGDEPIIKLIMDEFARYGISDFHISVNDKARMIKAYFHDHELPYNISYIEETSPLGTAGALQAMHGKIDKPFFVSNCDIIVRADYSELLKFHNQGGYDLTLVASMRHFVIPYGVCEVGPEGDLKNILEKPEYDFLVNTGLYLLGPDVLGLIPKDCRFDMTDLIDRIRADSRKVGVFPVSEKSWADIGQWAEYRETIKTLST